MADEAWKLLCEDTNERKSSVVSNNTKLKDFNSILSGSARSISSNTSTSEGRNASFLSSLGISQPSLLTNSAPMTSQTSSIHQLSTSSFSALNEAAADVKRETRAISSNLPHINDIKDADELFSLLSRDISALNDDSPVVRRSSLLRITVALFGRDLAMMAEDTSSIVTLTSSSSSNSLSNSSSSLSANSSAAATLSAVSHASTVSGKAVQLPEGISNLHVNVDPAYIHASFELSEAAALIMGKEAGTGRKKQLPTVDGKNRKDGSDGVAGDEIQSSTFTTSIAIGMSVSPIAHYAGIELSGGRGDAEEHAKTLLSSLWPELYKPLIKRFFDPHEACRVGAIALVAAFLSGGIVRDIAPCLPYLIPALTQKCAGSWVMDPNQKIFAKDLDTAEAHRRGKVIATSGLQGVLAGTDRDVHRQMVGEGSEPCRLLFARVLFSLLRSAILEGAVVLLDAYLHEIIMCAHALAVDPFPDLRVVAAPILISLADAAPHALKHYAVAILRSLSVGGLDHRHAKVRLATLDVCERLIMMEDEAKMKGAGSEAITHLQGGREANTIPVAAFYGRDTTVNYMAKLVLDSNATVRLRFAHSLGAWMTRLSDRYDYWSRLMPYMLSLLSDSSDTVVSACLTYLDACGVSHEIEHAKVIMEKRQFGIDGDPDVDYDGPLPYPFSLNGRPRLGVRLFVRANSTRFVKPILKELSDWAPFGAPGSIDMRSRAASLLTHVLTYQEEFATQDVHGLVGALVGTIHDGVNLSIGWSEEDEEVEEVKDRRDNDNDDDATKVIIRTSSSSSKKTTNNDEAETGDVSVTEGGRGGGGGGGGSVGYHIRVAARLCGRFLPPKAWLDVLLPIIEADDPSLVFGDRRGRGDSEILAASLHVLWLALGESELRPNRVLSQVGRVVNAITAGMPLELNLPLTVAATSTSDQYSDKANNRQAIISSRKRLPELCCVAWSSAPSDRLIGFTRRVRSCLLTSSDKLSSSSSSSFISETNHGINDSSSTDVTNRRILAAVKAKAIAKRQVSSSSGVSAELRDGDSSVVGVRSAQGTWPASFGGIPHRFVARSHLLASLSFCARILKGRTKGLQSVVPGGAYLDPKRIYHAILGAVLQIRAHVAMDTIEGRSIGWKIRNSDFIDSSIADTQSSSSPTFSYSEDIAAAQPLYEYCKGNGVTLHGDLCDKILVQLSYLQEVTTTSSTTTKSSSASPQQLVPSSKSSHLPEQSAFSTVPPLPECALPLIANVHSSLLTDCLTNYPTDSSWNTQNAAHRLLFTLISDKLLSFPIVNAENVLMMVIDLGRSLTEARDELGFSTTMTSTSSTSSSNTTLGGTPPMWREALIEWLRVLLSLSSETFTRVFTSSKTELTASLFGINGVLCTLSGRLFFSAGDASSGGVGSIELTSLSCELICRFTNVFDAIISASREEQRKEEQLSKMKMKSNKTNSVEEEEKMKIKTEGDKNDTEVTLADTSSSSLFSNSLSQIALGVFRVIIPRLVEISAVLRNSSTSHWSGGGGGKGRNGGGFTTSQRKDVYKTSSSHLAESIDSTITRLSSACSSLLPLHIIINENLLAEHDSHVLDCLCASLSLSFNQSLSESSIRLCAIGIEQWAQVKRNDNSTSEDMIKNSVTLILRSFHSLCAIAAPSLCALSGTTSMEEENANDSGNTHVVDTNNEKINNNLPSVADYLLGALYALSANFGGPSSSSSSSSTSSTSTSRQDAIKLACRDFLTEIENPSVTNEIANAVLEHLEIITMMKLSR